MWPIYITALSCRFFLDRAGTDYPLQKAQPGSAGDCGIHTVTVAPISVSKAVGGQAKERTEPSGKEEEQQPGQE